MITIETKGITRALGSMTSIEKNIPNAIGISMFQIAKRIRDEAKKNFMCHNKTGKAIRTIRARKVSNKESHVFVGRVVRYIDEGVGIHPVPNNPWKWTWRTAPNHPGVRADPIINPAIQVVIQEIPGIVDVEFKKIVKIS